MGARRPVGCAGAARRGWFRTGTRLVAGIRSAGPGVGEGERLQGRRGRGGRCRGPGAGGTARGDERDAKSQPVTALRLYKQRLLLWLGEWRGDEQASGEETRRL